MGTMLNLAHRKHRDELTAIELRQVRKLVLPTGRMWNSFWNSSVSPSIILLKNGCQVLGWAIVFRKSIMQNFEEIHVFVSPRHRRKGYGSMLYNKAKRLHGKIWGVKWDETSTRFYEKCGQKSAM